VISASRLCCRHRFYCLGILIVITILNFAVFVKRYIFPFLLTCSSAQLLITIAEACSA